MAGSDNSMGDKAPQAPLRARATVDDDFELLRRIERGEEPAFASLVERHAKYLHGVARAILGNDADAEDVVQETFAALLKAKFRGESAVRTFLVKILVRQAGMLKRKWWRRPKHLSLARDDEREPTRPAASRGIEAKLDLATMLASLSEDHRTVIVLRELEQMSYEEMAEALGVPRGTVESRLHRAREQLRRNFESYNEL
jgi:RNA polymerase sigma-70 factor (ECF subfamily)